MEKIDEKELEKIVDQLLEKAAEMTSLANRINQLLGYVEVIGSSQEQKSIVSIDSERIGKLIFRKLDTSQNIIKEGSDTLLLLDPKTKQPIVRLKNGKGITLYAKK